MLYIKRMQLQADLQENQKAKDHLVEKLVYTNEEQSKIIEENNS